MVDLTEHLGKEETVALLEGDTLPGNIVRLLFSFLSHANIDWA